MKQVSKENFDFFLDSIATNLHSFLCNNYRIDFDNKDKFLDHMKNDMDEMLYYDKFNYNKCKWYNKECDSTKTEIKYIGCWKYEPFECDDTGEEIKCNYENICGQFKSYEQSKK